MTEQGPENEKDIQPQQASPVGEELDAAGKSLSDALRISFSILKVIMVVLIIIFLASGFRTVESGQRALVLRFGKIRGVADRRILGPGLHWMLPYPVDQIVKIPVEQKINLAVNSFWYFQSKKEILSEKPRKVRPNEPLRPTIDGYCLTRGETHADTTIRAEGSDYNIVHSKWELTYRIKDPEAFFKNVYVRQPRPGLSYADVIPENVNPLLQRLVEDAVVTALVHYTIDQVKFQQVARVTNHVRRLIQNKLDKLNTGITVVALQLTQSTWPRQVDNAFQAAIMASQVSQQAISEARTYAQQTLNEAAGPVAEELFAAIKDPSYDPQRRELLWSQVAGQARTKIAQARAYRTEVVETAKANAEYLHRILPEYRKRPELVLQRIYADALEYILKNADEKFVIQTSKEAARHEIRVILNRDPTLKPKTEGKSAK